MNTHVVPARRTRHGRWVPLAVAMIVGVAAACAREAPRRGACLPYGPDTLQLAGTLRRLTFPGPPNYEDVAKGDEAEVGLYLDLAFPVCTAGGADSSLGERHDSVRQVQLVVDSAGDAALGPQVGQRVTIRGTLFPAHTGHHHAPVLVDVVR